MPTTKSHPKKKNHDSPSQKQNLWLLLLIPIVLIVIGILVYAKVINDQSNSSAQKIDIAKLDESISLSTMLNVIKQENPDIQAITGIMAYPPMQTGVDGKISYIYSDDGNYAAWTITTYTKEKKLVNHYNWYRGKFSTSQSLINGKIEPSGIDLKSKILDSVVLISSVAGKRASKDSYIEITANITAQKLEFILNERSTKELQDTKDSAKGGKLLKQLTVNNDSGEVTAVKPK